jgi:predicted DNA-binding WGR domain protein
MPTRRFEFQEGSSSKFWAIERQARTVTVTFGRIGTTGQAKAKAFPDENKATREESKLIAEKLRKGYREVGSRARPPAKVTEKPPATPKALAKPRRTTWKALTKAWSGARKVRSVKPATVRDVVAVCQALEVRRLPLSYLEYLGRFLALGELTIENEHDDLPTFLNIHALKNLVERRDNFRRTLESAAAAGEVSPKALKALSDLIPFGYDTSRTDICWNPSRVSPKARWQSVFTTTRQGNVAMSARICGKS